MSDRNKLCQVSCLEDFHTAGLGPEAILTLSYLSIHISSVVEM